MNNKYVCACFIHLFLCTPRTLQRGLRGRATVEALPVEEEGHFL